MIIVFIQTTPSGSHALCVRLPGACRCARSASRRPCARPTWHPPQNVAQYGQADVERSGRDTGALESDQPALDHLRRDPVVSRVSPIALGQRLMWPDSVPSVLRVLRPRAYSRSRYSCAKWSNLGFCTIAGSWLSFRSIIIRRSSSAAEAMVFASRVVHRRYRRASRVHELYACARRKFSDT